MDKWFISSILAKPLTLTLEPACQGVQKDPVWRSGSPRWLPAPDLTWEQRLQGLWRSRHSAEPSGWTLHLPEEKQEVLFKAFSRSLCPFEDLQLLTSGLSANFFFTTLFRLPSIPFTDFFRMSSDVSTSVTEWPVDAATFQGGKKKDSEVSNRTGFVLFITLYRLVLKS